jgi:hypothetical protein
VIAASLLLIAGAVVLLVVGLVQSSSGLLGASIAGSLLAAVVLLVGARRSAALRREQVAGRKRAAEWEPEPAEAPREPLTTTIPVQSAPGREAAGPARAQAAGQGTAVGQGTAAGRGTGPGTVRATEPFAPERVATETPRRHAGAAEASDEADASGDVDVDPPDEPAPQQVSAADAARVGRMLTEVLVVDGRPRYHLPGCVHLMGRESEPLPVGEAIELGFTPCSLCEPDSALLADARRV